MKWSSILLLFSFCTALLSCRKESRQPEPGDDNTKIKKVKKLIASNTDFMAYSYTSDQQVKQYISSWLFSPDGQVQEYQVNYSFENGKLISARRDGGEQLFHYQQNQLHSSEHFHGNGQRFATHFYTFNENGRLIEIEEQPDNVEEVQRVKTEFLYHPDGNLYRMITKQKRVGSNGFETLSELVYPLFDNKKHPIPAEIWGQHIPGLLFFKNNPLRIQLILPNGTVERTTNLTYQYNADGYPTEQQQQITTGGVTTPGILYSYEY